ncbi:hypothetical protein [Streptococcus agalactiae]|uniref:hypothetical protein n=1 Tax=Streptococcus agalactiae TaxID=1311 RepID=UPI00085CD748|nr:hypothetical protein [Streptococcus agalactiae]
MKKHGLSTTRIYSIFWGMQNRCLVPTNKEYDKYSKLGICDEWTGFDNFLNFYNWSIANGYDEKNRHLSIDRIDNSKGYSPDNCRWVTVTKNNQNQGTRKDNTSGIKGVNFDKRKKLWVVRISAFGKRIYIGRFKKLDDAMQARLDAEIKYWS